MNSEEKSVNLPPFGRYKVQDMLGEGAFAIVYRALDEELQRTVAMKILRVSIGRHEPLRKRFLREGRVLAGLSHPNLVTVYDAGEKEGRLFQVMELVDGRPLSEVYRSRGLKPRTVAELMEKVGRGMGAAHERKIVHRDLKPANILVTSGGSPKVSDFGLAHTQDGEGSLTTAGTRLGTPLYMAPEQMRGLVNDISPRTDVYALGAVLYEGLTGRPPHDTDDAIELLSMVMNREPDPPRTRNPKVHVDLETICMKALQKQPADRYADGSEFADDLRRFLEGEPIEAHPASMMYRFRRRVARSRGVVAMALAGVLLAGGIAAWLVPRWLEESRIRESREAELKKSRERDEARKRAASHLDAGRAALLDLDRLLSTRDASGRVIDDQTNRVMSHLQRALDAYPNFPNAYLESARMYRILGDRDEAIRHCTLAIQYGPDSAGAYMLRAIMRLEIFVLNQSGHSPGALARDLPEISDEAIEADLASVEKFSGSRDELNFARALQLVSRNQFAEAERVLEDYITRNRASVDAMFWRAVSLRRLGRHKEALAVIGAALEFRPASDRLILERAAGRRSTGNFAGAMRDFRSILKVNPDSVTTRLNYGFMLMEIKDDAGAVAQFTRLLDAHPRLVDAWTGRARARMHMRRYEEAIADATEAIRIDRDQAAAWFLRGAMRSTLRRSVSAIRDLNEAIRLDPGLATAFIERGILRHEAGDFPGALKDYDEAIRLQPGNALSFVNRSVVRRVSGDLEGAKADVGEAIRLAPNSHLPYTQRGEIHKMEGNTEAAMADWEQAVRLGEKDPVVFHNLGVAHANLKNYDKALESFSEAIRRNPKYLSAHHNRGLLHVTLGRKPEAIRDLKKAISLAPRDWPRRARVEKQIRELEK